MAHSRSPIQLNQTAFLGKAAQDLVHLSSAQVIDIYRQRGLIIPVEVSSTLLYLQQHAQSVLTDVSDALDIPHQLAAQRIEKLIRLGLLEKQRDPNDGRRVLLKLTRTGLREAAILDQCMEDVAVVYQQLFDEIDCDLAAKLNQAIERLNTRSLLARFEALFP
ncbi:MAG: MarR family transcriptional regulator [Pseudomonadota bacterium]